MFFCIHILASFFAVGKLQSSGPPYPALKEVDMKQGLKSKESLTSHAITNSCRLPLLPLTLAGAIFGTVNKETARQQSEGPPWLQSFPNQYPCEEDDIPWANQVQNKNTVKERRRHINKSLWFSFVDLVLRNLVVQPICFNTAENTSFHFSWILVEQGDF